MTESNQVQFDLPATYESLDLLSARLSAELQKMALPDSEVMIYNIRLAVDEIFANIVGHAYKGRSDGVVSITVTFNAATRLFRVDLHDTGCSFDPMSVSMPDLNDTQEHGYGLFLALNLMDNIVYSTGTEGNHWRLAKQL